MEGEAGSAQNNFIELDGQKIDLGDQFSSSGKIGFDEVIHSAIGHTKFYQIASDTMNTILEQDATTLIVFSLLIVVTLKFISDIFANSKPMDENVNKAPEKEPIVKRDFTIEQLREFDGGKSKLEKDKDADVSDIPIYVAIKGNVYNVTEAAQMYGPEGGYSCFAGREATRAMGKFSFEEKDLSQPYKNDDFGLFEENTLNDFYMKFDFKYDNMGCVSVPPQGVKFTKKQLGYYKGDHAYPYVEGQEEVENVEHGKRRIDKPIYIAVQSKVIDVSYGGKDFYGKGGPYHCFAGHDVTRALARMSLKPEDIQDGHDNYNPSNVCDGLSEAELKTLKEWEVKFIESRKYPVVGELID